MKIEFGLVIKLIGAFLLSLAEIPFTSIIISSLHFKIIKNHLNFIIKTIKLLIN